MKLKMFSVDRRIPSTTATWITLNRLIQLAKRWMQLSAKVPNKFDCEQFITKIKTLGTNLENF